MARSIPETGSKAFGAWLSSEIRSRGMNQAEFAKAMSIGTSTVSRWMNGRIPEAALLERIADVLVLDYDVVATRAGYRPRELLGTDLDSAEAQLLPYIRAIEWTPRDLAIIKAQLETMIKAQKGEFDQ